MSTARQTPTTPRGDRRADRATPTRVRCQDLTPSLLREWIDSACIDVAIDEDDDLFVVLDGTRLFIRVRPNDGMLTICCSILIDEDDDTDRLTTLETVNRINRRALFVRAVLRDDDQDRWVRYEHEHFALDGHVTRRQLVKLVRRVKHDARTLHRALD